MGAGSSTTTYQTTTYKLNDGNITVNGPGQRIGNATSSASTDVKPDTNLNYSEDINLSWTGTLNNVLRGSRDILQGTVGNNTQLIQSVKALGSAALRVSSGDSDFKRDVLSTVNDILDKSVASGATSILNSTAQITTSDLSKIIGLQTGTIERLKVAGDAFQTVCLGMSGMRNNEVTTAPSSQALIALKERASEDEKSRELEIMEIAGPRVGIMPRTKSTPEPDLIKNSIESAVTTYGRVGHIRDAAEKVTEEINRTNFSILHAKALTLSNSGILRASHWETSQFIGSIIQRTISFKAKVYPGGHIFEQDSFLYPGENDWHLYWSDTREQVPSEDGIATTAYAYDLPHEDSSRDIRLILSGNVIIQNQKVSPTPIRLGLMFKEPGADRILINKAVFINVDNDMNNTIHGPYGNISTNKGVTDIMEDVNKHYLHPIQSTAFEDPLDNSVTNFNDYHSDQTFSYVSQFQVAVNLSNADLFHYDYLGIDRKVRVVLVGIAPGTQMSIEVQTPILHTAIVSRPISMSLIGNKYDGTIIDLLGEIDDWYITNDPHDPVYIYEKLLEPIVIRSSTIARYHVKDGAAYALTASHVKLARSESGLPQLTDEDMESHIIELMTWIARWLYKGSPIGVYAKSVRKFLFMRLVENVMFHSLGHIEIYSDKYDELVTPYIKDCNDYNVREQRIDNAIVKSIQYRR